MILISLIILFACEVQSAKILGLFPHVGRSHHMIFEPLLKTLAENGHQVTEVSFFPPKGHLENHMHVSLQGLATIRKEALNLSLFENRNKIADKFGLGLFMTQINAFHPLANLAIGICSKLIKFAPLTEVLKKEYDVVILENFNSDCMLGLLHVYGVKVPVVTILSSPLLHWSASRIGVTDNPSFVPVMTSETTSKMSFRQRMENTIMNIYFKLWFRYNIQVKERALIENRFNRKIPDLQDLAKNASLMLVNTFHSLNGVRPLLPGVVEVGGMHLNHNLKPIPRTKPQAQSLLVIIKCNM